MKPIYRKLAVIAACAALSVGIDWFDSVTGEAYEFFILYFGPVAAAAWLAGLGPAVIVSLVSAAAWFQSDLAVHVEHSLTQGTWDTLMRLAAFLALGLTLSKVKSELTREKRLNAELAQAMAEIKQLRGILPMCSFCRKIRDADQQWIPLEKYIATHSDAQVSHGLCPVCYKKHYGEPDGT